RWFAAQRQVERFEQRDLDAREQRLGVLLEAARKGGMEQTQQQERDQRRVNLRLHRILGTAKKGFDPEILLDPLEEQLDLPALLVKSSDSLGAFLQIIGHQMQRFLVIARDNDFAQLHFVKRVFRSAARLLVPDLEP